MNWHDIFATRMSRMKASEIRELLKLLDQPDIISFAGGIPDPALFPVDAFQRAMGEALSPAHSSAALQYSVSEGYGPLRDWIAGEMGRIGVSVCHSQPDTVYLNVEGSEGGVYRSDDRGASWTSDSKLSS